MSFTKNAPELFEYNEKEFTNLGLKDLMPDIIALHHDSFIDNFI